MSDIKKSTDIQHTISIAGGEFADAENVLSTVISPNGQEIQINFNDVDEAMKYADDAAGIEIPPQEEKKLLRKIDCALLPIIAGLMSCNLMDKTTSSYAALMGLKTDLNMTAKDYTWVGSSFYLGYLVFQYPSTICLQKFPLSKALGTIVVLWGAILMLHAATSNAAGFIALRVILGAFESAMSPAYILLTSQWWKKEEQFMRSCIWVGIQGLGTLLGAGISYGLYTHRGVTGHAFESWRLLYIITGVITIVLGFISLIHVPDIPTKAWFLNSTEKKYVVARIRNNQQGFGNHHLKMKQVKEAFSDVASYILFFYGMSYAIPNGSFTNFGTILLHQDFGFTSAQSLLMSFVGGGIDVIFPPLVALICGRFLGNRRLLAAIIVNSIVFVGMCLLNFTHHKGSKLAGYFTFYMATAVLACVASVVSSNVAGSSKKTTVTTIYFIGYAVGNIIGPQTFTTAPYNGAKIAMLVSFAVGTGCLTSLYCIYMKRNNQRDAHKLAMGDKYEVPENIEFTDLTDKENPEFRYSL
ncbi:allantoate permease [Saccharomycopsis crataegensis]|uniref:Allantoate permease n=1 Tax=Saccharomycopsis crataegensis TaxID=43959 RepID=A0AAV5QFZ9_9ASCO|nr:allantoate permease [Saccharomycopsis crataegensis]